MSERSNICDMNDRQAAFVEEMGQYLSSVGMTPMAGRMLAWLLICDPAEQTAAELADALRASRGAISTAARSLETAGFLRRSRRRRRAPEHFSMPPGAILALVGGVWAPSTIGCGSSQPTNRRRGGPAAAEA